MIKLKNFILFVSLIHYTLSIRSENIYQFHFECTGLHCVLDVMKQEEIDTLNMEMSDIGKGYIIKYNYAKDNISLIIEPIFEERAQPPYAVDTTMIENHLAEVFKRVDSLFVKRTRSVYLSCNKTDATLYDEFPLLDVAICYHGGKVFYLPHLYFSPEADRPVPQQVGDMILEYSETFRELVKSFFYIAPHVLGGELLRRWRQTTHSIIEFPESF